MTPSDVVEPTEIVPLFLTLKGRKILLAGNGNSLLWKLRLMAASGAEILYTSRQTDSEISAWAQNTHNVQWLKRKWQPSDFDQAWLAIGSFSQKEKAEKFAAAAAQYKVPVNLVDRPHLCDFRFGSIVQRGPISIAISSSAASPALSQAVRSRVEAVLPSALGDWARAASTARQQISSILKTVAQRRRFWQHFAEKAMAGRPATQIPALLQQADKTSQNGRVMLVGAGPGDAENLTLAALRALQAADVILSDDLIHDEILQLARREARQIRVGKRAGRAMCRQEDIHAMMHQYARKGLQVVRLKSGDSSLFSRAAQEIDFLHKAGIEVEILPGITLASAAAARLGISLTNRDCARSVKFITGHSRHDDLPDLDWRACADPQTTLIVYMGGRNAAKLARELMTQGLAENTPVVAACDVAGDNQRFIHTLLHNLPDIPLPLQLPILIGIGQVFAGTATTAS